MSSYSSSAGYRPDIAGLRALAILSVVFFHAGVAGFGGGYVGIDIFFVIAGYLLTKRMLPEFAERTFSFTDFYARRVWKILPALTVLVCTSMIASAYFLMPDAFDEAGIAAQRTGAFVINHFLLGNEGDYWQQLAQGTQPLLHLWSLAVGVQFIVVLPCLVALLFLVGRRGDRTNRATLAPPPDWVVSGVLLGLILVSFGLSSAWVQQDPAASFYLLSSRLWEFLLGGLIASLAGSRLSRPPLWLAEAMSIFGLIGILWGVLTYTQATPYPGEYALPTVLGTSFILYSFYSRVPPLVSRLLSLRPVVWLGVLSYSLFLWHWPLLVLMRSTVWDVNGWPEISLWVYFVVLFAISWLSWKGVERPFASPYFTTGRARLALGAGVVMVAVMVLAGTRASRTEQQSLPPVLTQLDQDLSVLPGIACEGNPQLDAIRAGRAGCALGDPATLRLGEAPDYILLGDEQARMWVSGFDAASRDLGIHGVAMAYENCAPLRGAAPAARTECAQITNTVLDYVARSPVQQVILAGNWMEAAASAFAVPNSAGLPAAFDAFSMSLQETIQYLQTAGKAVTVILDIPHLANDEVPRTQTLLSVSQQGADTYGPTQTEHAIYQEPVLKSLEVVWPRVKPFGIVDPAVDLCATGNCLVAREGRTWYVNQYQLTDSAGVALREVFLPLLRSVSAPR